MIEIRLVFLPSNEAPAGRDPKRLFNRELVMWGGQPWEAKSAAAGLADHLNGQVS